MNDYNYQAESFLLQIRSITGNIANKQRVFSNPANGQPITNQVWVMTRILTSIAYLDKINFLLAVLRVKLTLEIPANNYC